MACTVGSRPGQQFGPWDHRIVWEIYTFRTSVPVDLSELDPEGLLPSFCLVQEALCSARWPAILPRRVVEALCEDASSKLLLRVGVGSPNSYEASGGLPPEVTA